jgi:ketosteroid isomerase-like protein
VSSSNVEIVRKAFEAWARRDFEAALALADAQVVLHDPGRTGATFRGHDQLKRFWEEWLEGWDEYRVEPKEFVEEGDEVFVASDQTGRASLTGIEVTQDLFQVFKLRDGVLVELRIYADRAPALDSMSG